MHCLNRIHCYPAPRWMLAVGLLATSVAVSLLSVAAAAVPSQCPADLVTQWRQGNPQHIINSANMLADSGDSLGAICRYQVVLEKLPTETTLKNNLGVLMFNHAMGLNQQQRFDEARVWLTDAITLQPGSPEPKKALAVTYFNEAMARRRTEETPDWEGYRALLQKAQSLDPSEAVFTEALASLAASEGAAMANRGQLDIAEARLTEALATLPADTAARDVVSHSLASVYIQQAKRLPKGSDTQKAMLEKAITTHNSDDIKELAKRVERGQAATIKAARSVDGGGAAADAVRKPLSMAEKLQAMRQLLGLPDESALPMPEQVATIEKQLYGDARKKEALQARVDDCYQTLLGTGQTLEHSAPNLVLDPLVQTTEGTYLANILNTTEGRIIRWSRFPINVFLDGPKDMSDWKAEMPPAAVMEALRSGVERWVWATHEYVTVVWVTNPNEADVVIHLKNDTYTDRFAEPGVAVLPDYTLPKASKLAKALGVASMFAPGYYGMAPRVGAAALQYKEAQKIDRVKEESEIHLGWDVLKSPVQVANIAAYEFGHALGLKGRSSNPEDIMHPTTVTATDEKAISKADVDTLMAIYQRPASIILNLQ